MKISDGKLQIEKIHRTNKLMKELEELPINSDYKDIQLQRLYQLSNCILSYITLEIPATQITQLSQLKITLEEAFEDNNLVGMRHIYRDFKDWAKGLQPENREAMTREINSIEKKFS